MLSGCEDCSVTLNPVDLLLSYAFHDTLDHCGLRSRLPDGSLVWIDSGAFTAYTKGLTITREEYAEHLRKNAGGYDYAFSLDSIGDPKASRENTEWLWEQGLKVVPVFHFGSPLSEFRSLCEDYGYVAAGGLVPYAKDRGRITKYLRHLVCEAAERGTAIHALGTAGRQTVIKTGVWSADSSTVSSAPLYGNVPLYDRKRRRLVMLQAADTAGLYRHRHDLLAYGFPLDVIMREKRWAQGQRPAMFRASLLAVMQMWADVREEYPVIAPERLWEPEGRVPKVPVGPRGSYAVGPGNESLIQDVNGSRVGVALDAGDGRPMTTGRGSGPRGIAALTTSEGIGAAQIETLAEGDQTWLK